METHLLHDALKPGADCVPIEELGRYADGSLAPEQRVTVSGHVDQCANCQAELALLHAFSDATVRDDERDVVRDGVGRLRRRESEIFGARREQSARWEWFSVRAIRPAFSLAAVLLTIVGSFYLFKSDVPRLPSDVGGGTETTRSLAVIVRTPVGDQVEAPERFDWQPVPGAVRYHVSLMEVDRRELWAIDTGDTAAMLPAAVRREIVPGKTLLWQVKALGAGDAPIAESSVERFRLAPR